MTLTRNGDLSLPLDVNLQSNDTSELTVPATITIPAHVASFDFTVDVVDDGIVDGDQVAIVTASRSGAVSATAQVTVRDTDSPTLALELDASQIIEGGSLMATIMRNALFDEPLNVSLAESNPLSALAQFTLPALTIPAGQESVTICALQHRRRDH